MLSPNRGGDLAEQRKLGVAQWTVPFVQVEKSLAYPDISLSI